MKSSYFSVRRLIFIAERVKRYGKIILNLAKQIQNRAGNIDKLEEELRQNHIHRLNQGKCWPGSGVVYVEILSNLQRVAAHSVNIAVAVLEEGEE